MKYKVARIVTSNYCVVAHLTNQLNSKNDKFELIVIGTQVEIYSNSFPHIKFIDCDISREFNFLKDIKSFFKLYKILRVHKPNITHSLMTKSGLLVSIISKLLSINIRIHTFTGQVWDNKKGLKRFILINVDKIICKLNTHCLTDSPSQSNFLYSNGISINNSPIPCLGLGSLCGVDFNRAIKSPNFHEFEFKTKMRIRKSDFIVSYIARKSESKGAIEMLKIFQALLYIRNDIKLLFIGPDESNGEIELFFKKFPYLLKYIINIDFVHNHFDYLSITNILALPSTREGFGSIVIDASAMKIPVIGYDIVGLRDSIQNNINGFLIEFGNRESFVERINILINNKELYDYISESSLNFAKENFSSEKINELQYQFYNQAINI